VQFLDEPHQVDQRGEDRSDDPQAPPNRGQSPPLIRLEILGDEASVTKYTGIMSAIRQYLVSASGQMSVPASVRHRWHLDNGGPVDVIDLGFGVLTVPAGKAKRLLGDLLSREDHAAFVASLADDPDLATT